MTDLVFKNIIEMCNKATSSPWTSYIKGRDFDSESNFIMTGEKGNRDYNIEFISIKPENQDFIAMTRNAIPLLINEIIKLKRDK